MTDEQAPDLPQTASKPRRWNWGWWGVGAVVIGLLALVAFRLYQAQAGQVSSGKAPDFTLELYDGNTFHLSDQRGKVVMIDFWASWCIPCREEAHRLETLWEAYRDRGVVFVGIAYADTDKEARAFLEEFSITYPNGPDLGTRISQAYRIRGVPETFLVDKCGRVRELIIGPATEAKLHQTLDTLLADSHDCS
jgi:cytochrome c biogenesis protein CcmG/thiol:disulfide interchange protein DsbE